MTQLAVAPKSERPPFGRIVKAVWKKPTPPPHEFLAAICPDEVGGFSVVATQYPGVISQGDTIEEARANIAEAFKAMLEACRILGRNLEFADSQTFSSDCQKVWITVDG